MNTEKIMKQVENLDYWDSQVLSVICDYFGDEVTLIYDYDYNDNVLYRFIGCVNINFHHSYKMDKPYKDLSMGQIAMFLQEVLVDLENDLYTFKINAHPLYLEIICKDIEINKIKKKKNISTKSK